MNNRLKELRRKEHLSQKEFGERVFLSQDQISLLELGKRKITERTINDICREFNVNRVWLETGKGDMYIDCLKDLAVEEEVKEITNMLFELDEEDRKAISNLINSLIKRKEL